MSPAHETSTLLGRLWARDVVGPPSVASGLVAVLVGVVGLVLAQALYLATLHPLASIPGPRLCAISRFPYWYQYFKGRDVQWMHRLHERYGPRVRFGPTDVDFTTVGARVDIFETWRGVSENPKATDFHIQPLNGVPSILTTPAEDHTRVRRIFSPAFSDRAVKSQEPLFKQYADLLIAKLGPLAAAGPVEMTRIINFCTFDIMAELCFGHPLGFLEKNEYNEWVMAIFKSFHMMPVISMIGYYPPLQALFNAFEPKAVTAMRAKHTQFSTDHVDRRMREGSRGRPDIWALVDDAQATDAKLTREEMHSNGELFMLAGTETSATLLSGAVFFLASDPARLARLAAEVRGAFGGGGQAAVTLGGAAQLPYLQACLKEALRLYPPAPIGPPRIIPAGGRAIDGRWMPAGTRVSVNNYAAGRAATNFRHPDAFAPERWLPEGAEGEYAGDVLLASQPFHSGPRNCLGQNVAMHEMRLILASLVLNFDVELCEESRCWSDQRAFLLWDKRELWCRLRPVRAVGE